MDDLISRQAALEKVRAMQTYKLFMGDDMILVDKAEVQTELMMLPPAHPEPHEGHWIKHETPDDGEQYECSECGVLWEFADGTPEDNEAYYCPKCGAKMTISTK